MQTEALDQSMDKTAAGLMASEGMMCEMELPRPVPGISYAEPTEGNAIHGLMLAIPVSLSLWGVIALLLWAIVR
jgi:hypothetical protein